MNQHQWVTSFTILCDVAVVCALTKNIKARKRAEAAVKEIERINALRKASRS
jgi:hypothetical protein